MDQLEEVLKPLPGYEELSEKLKLSALDDAVIPDSEGRWPGETGYKPTYDVYYAALQLVLYLKSLPSVTTATSEGTSVTTKPADWDAVLWFLRSKSKILRKTSAVLQIVPIPEDNYIYPTDMSGKGDNSYDTDTDMD